MHMSAEIVHGLDQPPTKRVYINRQGVFYEDVGKPALDGKGPLPVSNWRSRKIARAWRDNGTRWGCRIFIFSAGMRHSAASKSTSFHSARRSSPGRTNTNGASLSAAKVIG
jgi:hypothetical protein